MTGLSTAEVALSKGCSGRKEGNEGMLQFFWMFLLGGEIFCCCVKLLWLLLTIKNEEIKMHRIFFGQMTKKVPGRSPPQKLEVGQHSAGFKQYLKTIISIFCMTSTDMF